MTSVEGIIEGIIYKNEANGYTVCEIASGRKLITAVGYMPFINEGETIKANGRWVRHPDYGDQFKVELYEKVLPHTAEAIEKYLASGIVKGVGPVTAKKIVDRFGASALDVISNEPERLSEIKGISLAKAMDIGRALNEQRGLQDVVMFLQEYGISPSACVKIHRAYGDRSVAMIRENPYRLCEDVFGIGFKTADMIAMKLGVDPASLFRIKSGIRYVLSHAASNGHTYLPESMLKQFTARLLGIPDIDIEDALVSLIFDKAVQTEKTAEDSNVYLSAFYNAELGVCRRLLGLARTSFGRDFEDLDEKIEKYEKEEGLQLDLKQRDAVREAMLNGVMVITGGPGTGKTTIIKCILRLLAEYGHRAALAAPTGRAAKRMTEATGYEAKTIHRLLEMGYTDDDSEPAFQRNEENPIDADTVIIDEMSMVDILLMNHLLKAILPGARLILAGDADQLPSVGAGSVLLDIISCSGIRTVRLTEIFRQAEESMIIVNAHRINRGEAPVLNAKDKDFFFLSRYGQENILRTVIDLCDRRLPDTYGLDPLKDIQVLSPTKKGPAGVVNLNIELQKVLNPPDRKKAEKAAKIYTLREGDRVMQIKNNYSLRWEKPGDARIDGTGVFNGDMGTVADIDDDEMAVTVLFDDDRMVVYDYSILDELEPSFAVTVHKSQGSEFPVVVMPIFPGPEVLMTRNLLYTAVTRAREMVVLVGDEEVLLRMVGNKRETLRYSGLADKLKTFTAYADIK
ncbi:MAG: ATP-dependent RecD-like DNA helicase [Clostridiaceae bacterium]|nr:ATP-dependent RecD-like DNA helicase [Clostridiaceae bacterium]